MNEHLAIQRNWQKKRKKFWFLLIKTAADTEIYSNTIGLYSIEFSCKMLKAFWYIVSSARNV